ncbi:hypothetical protein [Sulfurovum sp.]|uniref:hypothetical protein n=1 Tax=Sulfurovum sp. TaxID=1969726 RepID=UPI0035662FEC
MKKTIFIIILGLFGQPVIADDCDLNQNTRVEKNIELQKKYPGSFLVDKNFILVVPVKEGEVRINIGGCVHYGVTIELKTKNASKYKEEKEFMNKILHLAKTYSQGMIKYEKLKKVIKDRNWSQPKSPSKFYFFNYDGSPFEVYETNEGLYTIIGFSSYS